MLSFQEIWTSLRSNARHFNQNDNFVDAFTDIDVRQIHCYSRPFSRSFSSLMNSWTSLKSR